MLLSRGGVCRGGWQMSHHPDLSVRSSIRSRCRSSISPATSHFRYLFLLSWNHCSPSTSQLSFRNESNVWLFCPLCHLSLSKCNYVSKVKAKSSISQTRIQISMKQWLAKESEWDQSQDCFESEMKVPQKSEYKTGILDDQIKGWKPLKNTQLQFR